MTLEGLDKEKEDAPLFVPIGGGSYIKAKLGSAETMIAGLGADVAVEKTVGEAKESLGHRIEDLEKTRTSLWQQLNEVIGKIQDGRAKLDEIASSLREKRRPQSVRETKKRT